jgi:CRP/FNR family cyclic AMP-dependent transcriptional regulator
MTDALARLLEQSAWTAGLTSEQRQRVERDTIERAYPAGAVIFPKGEPALHWPGVIEGMIKADNVTPDGRCTTFIGVSAGGWFGEGSVLKREARPYEIVALRDSRLALLPRDTFEWLLGSSLPFNRFLIDQLNARLGQFVALVEQDRMHDASSQVAHCLAELCNPQLNPAGQRTIAISQEEVGRLSGNSRQITNRALHQLQAAGLVGVSYGAIDVFDVEGLRRYSRSH